MSGFNVHGEGLHFEDRSREDNHAMLIFVQLKGSTEAH